MGYPINYPLNRQTGASWAYQNDQIVKNFIDWIILNNNQYDSNFGGNYGFKKFDEQFFKELIAKNVKSDFNSKELLELYFQAIHLSMKIKTDVKYFVEKSVENFEYAEILANYFPNSKFIHIIRNPYHNLVSLRNYQHKIFSGHINFKNIIGGLFSSYYYCMRNTLTIKGYYVLKYEELVANPTKEMKAIANYLNITFNDNLLKPTVLGDEWGGNSINDKVYKKITINNFQKKEITPYEIILVNKYLDVFLSKYNYLKIEEKYYKIFKSNKYESIREDFKNRALLLN